MTETPPRQIAAELLPHVEATLRREWKDHWPQEFKRTACAYLAVELNIMAGLIGKSQAQKKPG